MSRPFWSDRITKMTQDGYRELLISVARLGYAQLWWLLYNNPYNKMPERVILNRSYYNAAESGYPELADHILAIDPKLEEGFNRVLLDNAGRLSRAIKKGNRNSPQDRHSYPKIGRWR